MSNKDRKLFSKFKLRGKWWIPGKEDRKANGIFVYDSGEIMHLKLMDAIETPASFLSTNLTAAPVILGQLDGGSFATLLSCNMVASNFGGAGHARVTYRPQFGLFGFHWESEAAVAVREFDIELTGLHHWIGERYFQPLYEEGTTKWRGVQFVTGLSLDGNVPRQQIELSLNPVSSIKMGVERVLLTHSIPIRVKAKEKLALCDILRIAHELQKLFTFFCGEAVFAHAIRGYEIEVPGEPGSTEMKDPRECPFDVVYQQAFQRKPTIRNAYDVLLPLKTIKPYFETVLQCWFDKDEKLDLVLDTFNFIRRADSLMLSLRFLMLTQALESFHRQVVGGCYASESDFAKLREKLGSAIPDTVEKSFRDKINGTLMWLNEPSLMKRLKETLASLQEPTRKFVTRDKSIFAKSVVDTRNHLTHLSKKEDATILEGGDLWIVTLGLEAILTVVIARYLGIPEEVLLDRFKSSRHFSLLADDQQK